MREGERNKSQEIVSYKKLERCLFATFIYLKVMLYIGYNEVQPKKI